MSYTLKAFNQVKTISKANKDLLLASSNGASSISFCVINKTKYNVSTKVLNEVVKNS